MLLRHSLIVVLLIIILLPFSSSAIAQESVSVEDVRAAARDRSRARAETDEAALWAAATTSSLRRHAAEAVHLLQHVEQLTVDVSNRMAVLLENDTGRLLGADPAGVIEFARLLDTPAVSNAELQSKRAFTSSFIEFLEEQSQGPTTGYVPSAARTEAVHQTTEWARDRIRRLESQLAWLDEPRETNGGSMEVLPTLSERVRSYRASRAQALARAREQGAQEALTEALGQISDAARIADLERLLFERESMLEDARAEIERARRDFEAKLMTLEGEQAVRLAEMKRLHREQLDESRRADEIADANRALQDAKTLQIADTTMQEADRIRLEHRARSTETRQLLAPFIAEGTWQPGDHRSNRRVSRAPMSLRALREFGALSDGVQGLKQLCAVANGRGCEGARGNGEIRAGKHADTMRPKWGYPRYFSKITDDELDKIALVQHELNELGPTLVRLGMLAP